MIVFNVVLRQLPFISHHSMSEEIRNIILLEQQIPAILLIPKDAHNGALVPVGFAAGGRDVISSKSCGDHAGTVALKVFPVDASHDVGLVGNDDQLFALPCISKEAARIHPSLPLLHLVLYTHPDVFGYGIRFLLREGRHDGDEDFAASVHRVDVLFLKKHGDVLVLELPDVFQAVESVAGKAAD